MAAGVGEGDMTGSDSGSRDAGGKLWLSFKGMAWRSGCWRGWQKRGTDGEHGTDCKSTVTKLQLKKKITARKLQQTARTSPRASPPAIPRASPRTSPQRVPAPAPAQVPSQVHPRVPVRVPERAPAAVPATVTAPERGGGKAPPQTLPAITSLTNV